MCLLIYHNESGSQTKKTLKTGDGVPYCVLCVRWWCILQDVHHSFKSRIFFCFFSRPWNWNQHESSVAIHEKRSLIGYSLCSWVWTFAFVHCDGSSPLAWRPCAGSRVVRIDPLRFLAGCRTTWLNQSVCLSYILAFFIVLLCIRAPFMYC